MLPSQVPASTILFHQDSSMAFAPVLDTASMASSTRLDSACIQTVEVPVWYGADYNTCSIQTTTATCSVSFPTTSCHTARPRPLPELDGMSEAARLWIVFGVAILLMVIIPVLILWARWKISAPRRNGKRSISIELEKNRDKKSSKATSASSSTPETSSKQSSSKASGGKKVPKAPNAEGRVNGSGGLSPGRSFHSQRQHRPSTDCIAGAIKIVNNIYIGKRRPNQQPPTASPTRRTDDPPPMSPRIELDSLPLAHPARRPENQPWMHRDRNGRWVPREEGYLHPGLPPPPHLRNGRADVRAGDWEGGGMGGEFYNVPGAWHH